MVGLGVSLVDDNVTVRVFGLVGGPPHVCKVSCEAIPSHFDIAGFESIISIESPENPPGGFHITGRQLYIHSGLGPAKVQHEGPRDEFTEGDLLPVFLNQALYHRLNAWPNRFASDERSPLAFCRKQIGKAVKQGPKGIFRRSSVRFAVLKLGRSKTTGACSVPRLVRGPEKSFDDWN
jgi:hypothetical protein